MSNATPETTTSSYLDFVGLAQLKGQAAHDPKKALRASAEQFEAYFIQEMMKSMRKTVDKSDLLNTDHADMYQDLFDKEVALQMTRRGGMGLANMLEREMLRRDAAQAVNAQQAMPLHTAAEAMAIRPNADALPVQRDAQKAYAIDPAQGAKP